MSDFLLLLGVALCALSLVAAIVSVLMTRAPRGAAILLVAGILSLALAAWVEPGSVGFDRIPQAMNRVLP
ncbi:hypothetical protein [Paracoccus jeotgali]|uniref:hypothetical protein n=1 Tax=Paracoccus jeotgali TaxID=2065379 RepID=UPI0028AE754C|nr:hypothetical protein [Paracoccus jeotgali]